MHIDLLSYIENIPVAVRQKKLRRQVDRSTNVDGPLVKSSVTRAIVKTFSEEGKLLVDILEPFTLRDSELREVGKWSHDHYSAMLASFLPKGLEIPDPVTTMIVAKNRKESLLAKLHEQQITYLDDVGGLSIPSYGLNVVVADEQSGWSNDGTVAHEELHSFRGFRVASDLWGDEYGFKSGFRSFSAESGVERGRVAEEGMAAVMAFEVLMSRNYQEGRRANYSTMLKDIGHGEVKDIKPLLYSQEYMDWLDDYLWLIFPRGTKVEKYHQSAKIVGGLLAKAREKPEIGVSSVRNLMMAARVDGSYTRQMMEMVDKVVGRQGFTRDWFQTQFDQADLDKMKRLAKELS